MNRQQKRMAQRQGLDPAQPRAREQRARPSPAAPQKERIGPRRYIAESAAELKKVAWPTRKEVTNSTLVVLICVVVMTTLIFAFDLASSNFVLFLFD